MIVHVRFDSFPLCANRIQCRCSFLRHVRQTATTARLIVCAMMQDADEQMWTEFEQARQLSELECGTDAAEDVCMVLEDEEDEASPQTNNDQWSGRQKGSMFVELPNGDFHVCFGINCKHASVDASKHIWCTLTGIYVGFHAERDHDASWTGRSTSSANPDDTAGTPQGGWLKRRDMYQASVDAHRMANRLTDEQCVYVPREKENKTSAVVKRGALCVDEVRCEDGAKRQRTAKRSSGDSTREAFKKLQSEALNVIEKLVSVEHCHAAAACASADPVSNASSSTPAKPPVDPRHQNLEYVRLAALTKYAKDVQTGARPFNMSTLHDIFIHANEFVKRQRAFQRQQDQQTLMGCPPMPASSSANTIVRQQQEPICSLNVKNVRRFDGQTLRCCADLIVNLWTAVCSTPYMRDGRRGNDSFRPFAAGILYGFKRGTYLPDGTCIVPELPMIAAQLPQLRSQQASSIAKQLQSSSHRGLCSLHRSIASLEEETDPSIKKETQERFRVAAAGAAMLRALCTRAGH